MSIEQALVSQPRPSMLAAKLRNTYAAEVLKGCQAEIAPHPVALEPFDQSGHGTDQVNDQEGHDHDEQTNRDE